MEWLSESYWAAGRAAAGMDELEAIAVLLCTDFHELFEQDTPTFNTHAIMEIKAYQFFFTMKGSGNGLKSRQLNSVLPAPCYANFSQCVDRHHQCRTSRLHGRRLQSLVCTYLAWLMVVSVLCIGFSQLQAS